MRPYAAGLAAGRACLPPRARAIFVGEIAEVPRPPAGGGDRRVAPTLGQWAERPPTKMAGALPSTPRRSRAPERRPRARPPRPASVARACRRTRSSRMSRRTMEPSPQRASAAESHSQPGGQERLLAKPRPRSRRQACAGRARVPAGALCTGAGRGPRSAGRHPSGAARCGVAREDQILAWIHPAPRRELRSSDDRRKALPPALAGLGSEGAGDGVWALLTSGRDGTAAAPAPVPGRGRRWLWRRSTNYRPSTPSSRTRRTAPGSTTPRVLAAPSHPPIGSLDLVLSTTAGKNGSPARRPSVLRGSGCTLDCATPRYCVLRFSCPFDRLSPHNCNARGRYWIASARCATWMRSLAARSAIVRASFRMRW